MKVTSRTTGESWDLVVVATDEGHWTFLFDADPGLSRAVTPSGRTIDTHEPYGTEDTTPAGVPHEVWVLVMEELAVPAERHR